MLNNSNGQRELSPIEIEQLQSSIKSYEEYSANKKMTRRDVIVSEETSKFNKEYPQINMGRSSKINPLTACVHGTKASTILSSIMFSKGQLWPANGIRGIRVFDIIEGFPGNQMFVSTVHLNGKISLKIPFEFAEFPITKAFDSTEINNRINKRWKNRGICDIAPEILDSEIIKIFDKLLGVPVVILGDGIGKFEGNVKDIVRGQPGEVLYERFNIRIIAVEKDHIELMKSLTKINTELKIAVIDKEELLNFTNDYNTKLGDNSTNKSFIEEVIEHFGLDYLKFSEKVEPVTIKKRLMYNTKVYVNSDSDVVIGKGLVGCIKNVSFYVKYLKQKTDFYNEAQIKEAIEKKGKIDGYDPIVYALLSDVLLDEKFPIVYAIEQGIKIEDIDPTLWAKVNKYKIGVNEDPIDYAIEHKMLIEGEDAQKWKDAKKDKRIEDEEKKRKEKLHSESTANQNSHATNEEVYTENKAQNESERPKQGPAVEEVQPGTGVKPSQEHTEEEVQLEPVVEQLQPRLIAKESNLAPVLESRQESETREAHLAKNSQEPKPTAEKVPSLTVDIHEVLPQPEKNIPDTRKEPTKITDNGKEALEQSGGPMEQQVFSVLGDCNEEDLNSTLSTPEKILQSETEPVVADNNPTSNSADEEADNENKAQNVNGQPKQKPKSNSKYYIVGCAIGGAIIGAVIAHFAGAAALVGAAVAVFFAAAVVGALLGAGIGYGISYGISKCFDSPDVQSMSGQEKQLPVL